jgi:4-hydroxyphenylacetate 3-monooxygenase oxygenase component
MGARSGREFLKGLSKPRELWVGDDKVRDIGSHPAFAGAAHTIAQIFDLQHQARDICLMPDPETGEPIGVSHMIPRSIGDLSRRHACLQKIAEFTGGLMGRTPDYMNVTFAGFAGRVDEWAVGGNERGAANLVAYQKFLARNDIALTHTIVHPTIDKAKGDVPEPGNEVALHKVADTAHGILLRGARILATLAPFADEIAVYPAMPLAEGTDAYALSFCIPTDTPGLKFVCRDSCATARNSFDHPLSSRFDEQDAFVIFDNVEVPRDRVFIDANRDAYNTVMTTGWYPNVMQQTMIRAQTKLEFAYGLANRMAEAINDSSPATRQMLGEIWTYAEFARAAIHSAEVEAFDYGNGVWFPNGGPLAALRAALPAWFPRVGEIITQIGSHNLLAAPSQAQLADPQLRPLLDQFMRGAGEMGAQQRARVFRLAWDFVGTALAGRNELYERFYLASGARNYQLAQVLAPKERARRLVDELLGTASRDERCPAESEHKIIGLPRTAAEMRKS